MAPGIPHDRGAPAGPPSQGRAAKLRQWLRGWLDWRLLLIGVVMLGVELGEGGANNWLTLAVRNGHGQTAAVAALFLTLFAAGEALARIFGGPIVDRLGRVRTIRVTTALGVIGVVLFIQAGNLWVVVAGVLLWAVGVSMGFPLGMSAAAESGPDPAARVSVVASIGYIANLAGPPAIGVLAQSAGLLSALWLIVALFLTAFAAAGSLRPRPAAPAGSERVRRAALPAGSCRTCRGADCRDDCRRVRPRSRGTRPRLAGQRQRHDHRQRGQGEGDGIPGDADEHTESRRPGAKSGVVGQAPDRDHQHAVRQHHQRRSPHQQRARGEHGPVAAAAHQDRGSQFGQHGAEQQHAGRQARARAAGAVGRGGHRCHRDQQEEAGQHAQLGPEHQRERATHEPGTMRC
jgi:hypothetical protein